MHGAQPEDSFCIATFSLLKSPATWAMNEGKTRVAYSSSFALPSFFILPSFLLSSLLLSFLFSFSFGSFHLVSSVLLSVHSVTGFWEFPNIGRIIFATKRALSVDYVHTAACKPNKRFSGVVSSRGTFLNSAVSHALIHSSLCSTRCLTTVLYP